MAAPKYLPLTISLNVPDEEALNEARKALRNIKRGASLADDLKLVRALIIGRRHAMQAAQTNRPDGRGYNEAFSSWLKQEGFDTIGEQPRRAMLYLGEHWGDTLALIEKLHNEEPDILEEIGPRGLRDRVKAQMEGALNAPKGQKPPKEKPYNYGDGAWRAMGKHGLTFDKATETFVVADEARFFAWAQHVLGKSMLRDGVDPEAEYTDAPPARDADDPGPEVDAGEAE